MWEPTGGADGALHVERLVDGFAAPLLRRWREESANHSLSVVLFTRVDGGRLAPARDVFRVVLSVQETPRKPGVFGLWRPLSRSDSSRFGSFLDR